MNSFFQKLTHFLEKEVTPVANRLDEDEDLFREVYTRFVKLGCLNLLIPKNLGGLGGGRREWIEYNILMAQYSGALLFLQAQHQFSVSRLKKLLPHPKVEEALRSLVKDQRGIGLALAKTKTLLTVDFFQNATADANGSVAPVRAEVPCPSSPAANLKKSLINPTEGYRLSGTFRWATGFRYFSHLLVSFYHEERIFYTLLPFQELQQAGASIAISPRIETVVFDAIPSTSVTLQNWLIPKEEVLASHEILPETPVEHPTIYNFAGVSKALLSLVLQSRYAKTSEVQQQYAFLSQRWDQYYAKITKGTQTPRLLRKEGLELTEQCTLLARISCGSAGILKTHPLGRLIRETWQYAVAGYSEDQVKSYLKS